MAANGYAVNQAAVNSGYNIVQFGAAAITAVAAITADITYVHVTTFNAPSTATLESYAWQFHNVPFSAKAKATVVSTPWVQKWETANFSADAEITSYILAVGANGIFNARASIQPDITYKWRSHASATAQATSVIDEFQSNHATAFPTGTATFYPEGMLKLSGQSIYTHDGSAKPTILGEATFADIQAILKPDGWYAPCTASMQPTINFKRAIASKPKASAKFFAGIKYIFRDVLNLSAPATLASDPVVTVYVASASVANATVTNATGHNRQTIKSTMSAPAVFTATPFATRFGTYPIFDGVAEATADAVMDQAGSSDIQALATITGDPFQWHFHDDGASNMSAAATVTRREGELLKSSDAVTFARPAELKDFVRPADTKEFTRVAT